MTLKEADDKIQNLLICDCPTDSEVADILQCVVGELKRAHARIDELKSQLVETSTRASHAANVASCLANGIQPD